MRTATTGSLLGAVVLLLAGCGGDGGSAQQQAFLRAMVPHHRSAVDMAVVAEAEARTAFVRRVAGGIKVTQRSEIGRMDDIHRRLYDAPLRPDEGAHAALGMSAKEAGMDHMDAASMIRGERPFDRAFVDEMIPHHEGAIRMAEAVMDYADDPALRGLAEGIVASQQHEIEEMKRFRALEYGRKAAGEPSDAGRRG